MDALLDALGRRCPDLHAAGDLTVSGLRAGAVPAVVALLARAAGRPILVLTASRAEADALTDDLQLWLPGTFLFPEIEMSLFDEGQSDPDRLQALHELGRRGARAVVAPLLALLQPCAPPEALDPRVLRRGQALDRQALLEGLERCGYTRASMAEKPGQFCEHHQVVDLYPSNGDPLRLEWADSELAALRRFDPDTQRSTGDVEEAAVLPVHEPDRAGSLLDHFEPGDPVVVVDPGELRVRLRAMRDAAETGWRYSAYQGLPLPSWRELLALLGERPRIELAAHGDADLRLPFQDPPAAPEREPLWVVTRHPRRARLRLRATVVEGALSQGFRLEGLGDLLTDRELFGLVRRPRYEARGERGSLLPLEDLEEGDLVVHAERGIARYEGMVPVEVLGHRRDWLRLAFANDDSLLVPPEGMRLVTRYHGSGPKQPALSRLGVKTWAKARDAAAASLLEMARGLLAARSEREELRAVAAAGEPPRWEDLEAGFPYDETPDQLAAVAEIRRDMARPVPMDRLLCGDVGYGKTEVALRAVYQAVGNGLQAAVLVPTTVLAQQHLDSFRQRLEPLGVRVGGFWGGQDEDLEALSCGEVGVAVGTHRLLSEEVTFGRLGLLVVDEEQQFGVTHKARLRELGRGVHLLSMTATPIPRTMQLALAGLKDVSLLETPPESRRPIRTYVLPHSNEVVRGAVMRELERGGQVFLLHNRVSGLDRIARSVRRLVPGAKVVLGHGQLPPAELEAVLESFASGEADVLVCTTIVEAGVDIRNANTMIVQDAQNFGLGQLYQIRGRVGRSGRQAWCYLLHPAEGRLDAAAELRLATLREFTALGSGYQVAVRDLEIRGAGDLLGEEQSGHIGRLGFALYRDMLEEALARLRGEEVANGRPGASVDLPVDAYLPASYVAESRQRITLSRRLSEARSEAEVEDLAAEIRDRFGPLPEPVANLLALARLRLAAARCGLEAVRARDGVLEVGERTLPLNGDPVAAAFGALEAREARAPGT